MCAPFAPAIAAFSAAVVTGMKTGKLGLALKAGVIAGATALAFQGVGSVTTPVGADGSYLPVAFGSGHHVAKVAGHAAVGCASAVASGGKCGAGAAGAGVSAFATPLTSTAFAGNPIGGTAAHAVIGGLGSVAGGGKFENGAVTAAFGYLFNYVSHPVLRATVPGQVAFDYGMTALEEGRYGSAAFGFGAMLGEQVLTVLTLGLYRPATILGTGVLDALRASEYTFTETVLKNVSTRPYINSPLTIREITSTGTGVPDPQGLVGALRYDVPGTFNGSQGMWELVINPQTSKVYHFLFNSKP